MIEYTTANGNMIELDDYEYIQAMKERRIISTAGSPFQLLLPEKRQPTTAEDTT